MAVQATRMQSLVADLLTLSQLEGSPAPGALDLVEMQPLLDQIESDARALSALQAHSELPVHRLVLEAPEVTQVVGSRHELLSAFSNLVSNAVRYTPAGGEVHVRVRRTPEGGMVFSVQDTGPGIAPEHLPRLSERFYRVDRSRSRETGGTGLGLAITKHVIQRHGGSLHIESQLGKGSTFSLQMPASRVR
jgi:two-component system phosphate regulon sensor histidine kinase PhoR